MCFEDKRIRQTPIYVSEISKLDARLGIKSKGEYNVFEKSFEPTESGRHRDDRPDGLCRFCLCFRFRRF